MLNEVLTTDFWEVVLLVYNHLEGPRVEPLIAKARDKEIGLIAMKVFAGGMQGGLKAFINDKTKYPQAAIRWVLGNPHIDACICTMSTFSHVEDYVAASGTKLSGPDRDLIARYRREAGPFYCRVSCRECLSSCPNGVAVNDVLRYGMYFEHYDMQKAAIQLYGALDDRSKPAQCHFCHAPCELACPYGLRIKEKLIRSDLLLTA